MTWTEASNKSHCFLPKNYLIDFLDLIQKCSSSDLFPEIASHGQFDWCSDFDKFAPIQEILFICFG